MPHLSKWMKFKMAVRHSVTAKSWLAALVKTETPRCVITKGHCQIPACRLFQERGPPCGGLG